MVRSCRTGDLGVPELGLEEVLIWEINVLWPPGRRPGNDPKSGHFLVIFPEISANFSVEMGIFLVVFLRK